MANRSDRSTARQLREAGLRVTAPRHAVLDWLAEHPHATAKQVSAGLHRQSGSLQGVYDVLEACAGAGLVRKVELAGHPARFECHTAYDHHHLACRECGSIEDVDSGDGACLSPSDTGGFDVDQTEVVFWGRCPACRAGHAGGSATTG